MHDAKMVLIIAHPAPFYKTNPNSHLILLLHLCEPQGQATAWQFSPWHHSCKHGQAPTCVDFRNRGLRALPKGALESGNLPQFFFCRTRVGSKEIFFKSFHLLIPLKSLPRRPRHLQEHTLKMIWSTTPAHAQTSPAQPSPKKVGKRGCM